MEITTYKPFKEKFSLEQRVQQFQTQMAKYPNMVPIVVEINKKAKDIRILDKPKFLVSNNVKMYEFQQNVSKKLNYVNAQQGLFFFINERRIENQNRTIQAVYNDFKDKEDGFLYITYSLVDRFG